MKRWSLWRNEQIMRADYGMRDLKKEVDRNHLAPPTT
jgi:hypothetical protein